MADLSTPAVPLLTSESEDYFEGVLTPDGKTLAYQYDTSGSNQADLFYRAISGDTATRSVSATPFVEIQPRFAPDGKWITFVTDASGATRLVVAYNWIAEMKARLAGRK